MSPPSTDRPTTRPKTLTFITSNANKLSEVRAILGSAAAVDLQSQSLDLVEMQGGGVEEIARDKCRRAAEMVSQQLNTFLLGREL